MAALGYDTVSGVVTAAANELGIATGIIADPYASTNPAIAQLLVLLTSCGQELVEMFEWQQLTKTYTITTVYPGDTGDYPLPTDFSRMIDQSGWERSMRNPLGGPLDSQDWQMVTNNNTLASIYVAFRIFASQFSLFPRPPANGLVINFEYISRNWVSIAGSTVLSKDAPTVATDLIYFDRLVMIKFLKLRFREARGGETDAFAKQFEDNYARVTGKIISAPVLSLTRKTLFPYLGDRNIPTTRYGL